MLKAGFISLGCSKNLVDTEVMLGILAKNNIEITAEPAKADILIVNTCTFIQSAKEESITTILNMAEYKQEGIGKCRSLIIAGCMGQRYGQELLEEFPEVDAIVGTGAWSRIMEAVEATIQERKRVLITGESKEIYTASTPRIFTTPFYSAYIKIAEGCNHRCAYCAIPYVRGNYRSRTIDDIKQEVEALAEKGVKEFNIIAQDTTYYGRDIYGKPSLVELLKELVKIEKVKWLRIQYAYPHTFTDELIDLIASEDKICNYVDLPLQHAHNDVLKRMRRSDTKESVEALLAKLHERIPGVVPRPSFIVGFPGETDSQYTTLRNFVEKQRFDKVGIFSYSREEGTPAYDMPNQVDENIMQERYHDLMSLQSKISETINIEMEGKVLDVLIEGRDDEQHMAYGRSYREAPDVEGQVFIEGDDICQPGEIVKVRILQGFDYDVVGDRVDA